MNWANISENKRTYFTISKHFARIYVKYTCKISTFLMKTTENYISSEYITVFLIQNDQIPTKFCQKKNRKLKKWVFTAFFLQKLNEFGSKLIQKLPKNILRGKCIHVVNESIVETSWYVARLMNFGLWIFWDFFGKIFQFDLVPNWQFSSRVDFRH